MRTLESCRNPSEWVREWVLFWCWSLFHGQFQFQLINLSTEFIFLASVFPLFILLTSGKGKRSGCHKNDSSKRGNSRWKVISKMSSSFLDKMKHSPILYLNSFTNSMSCHEDAKDSHKSTKIYIQGSFSRTLPGVEPSLSNMSCPSSSTPPSMH